MQKKNHKKTQRNARKSLTGAALVQKLREMMLRCDDFSAISRFCHDFVLRDDALMEGLRTATHPGLELMSQVAIKEASGETHSFCPTSVHFPEHSLWYAVTHFGEGGIMETLYLGDIRVGLSSVARFGQSKVDYYRFHMPEALEAALEAELPVELRPLIVEQPVPKDEDSPLAQC